MRDLHPTLRTERTDGSIDARPHPAMAWLGIVLVELALVGLYFGVTDARPTRAFRYLVYPFVWINVGLWAVHRTTPLGRSRTHRVAAAGLAVAYFLAMLWIPGQLRIGGLSAETIAASVEQLRVTWYVPGWGPIVATDGAIRIFLVPFEVIGYGALSYLVYATLLDASRGAVSGLLGAVTCVGCTVPVLVPLLGVLGGPAAGLATTAYAWSYDLGTLVFVLTVGLLVWSHRHAGP